MIKCLFCRQDLKPTGDRWDYDFDMVDGHYYECTVCQTKYSTSERVDHRCGTHYEEEEIDYYAIQQGNYEVECYTYPSGSCQVKRLLGPSRANFICHFSFIPPNLSPQTLLQRIKTWIVFS